MDTIKTIMAEVRESRRRMSAECAHDPRKLIEYLQAFNRKYSAQVRRFQRKHRAVHAANR